MVRTDHPTPARPPRALRLRVVLVATIALGACSVSPDYRPPEPIAVDRYTATPIAASTASAPAPGGEAQHFHAGRDIPAEWWKVFQSAALDELIRRALAGSPTLVVAQARLRQAQDESDARSGATSGPVVDARLSAYSADLKPESVGAPNLPVGSPLNLYLASIGVSYTFDIFGGRRRELEGLRAEVDVQRFELEAARLMLTGNVVTSVVREAALRERLARSEELIALQAKQLGIAERSEQAGGIAAVELARQRGDLATARAALPELQLQLEQVRHRLAVYLGQPPGLVVLPEFRLAELRLPTELPVTLPSELARRRPDIQAAEALLQRASARVGVAEANRYPQVTLSASAGSLSTSLGDPVGFYLLGASLVQPLLRGAELDARRRSADAAYDQAGAAYREAVLRGLREVADALRALEADATRVVERTEALAQARAEHAVAKGRYDAGGVSVLAVLEAERRYQRASIEQVQAIADRHADTAALFQALGGGWSVTR